MSKKASPRYNLRLNGHHPRGHISRRTSPPPSFGRWPMLGKVLGAIILSLIGSIIYFFVERGFLDTHFFRSDPISAVEQARINALTAEAVSEQEAAAKAQAEAEADRRRRQALEREIHTRQQQSAQNDTAQKSKATLKHNTPSASHATSQEEALAYQRRSQQQAQAAAEQQTRRAAAFRAANGGCNPGSHRVCVHVGPPAGGYNAGCYCHSD